MNDRLKIAIQDHLDLREDERVYGSSPPTGMTTIRFMAYRSFPGTIHAPSTYDPCIPLCMEAIDRRLGREPCDLVTAYKRLEPEGWATAEPDAGLKVDCKDCIEWINA